MKNPIVKKHLVVAGIPRSGTTALFRALAGLKPKSVSPKGSLRDSLPIVKTHCLPPPYSFGETLVPKQELVRKVLTQNKGKAIFVFGNPLMSVISTRYHRWERNHAMNCGFFGNLADVDIYDQDCFNYEKMFDTWTQKGLPYPVLCVKYEDMWDHQEEISDFCGIKFKLPKYKTRSTGATSVDVGDLQRIFKTYGSLHMKWMGSPPIWRSS